MASRLGIEGRRSRRFRCTSALRLKADLLDQLHPLQARVPVLADDDVVVHGNAERGGDLDDRFGHLDIGLRGRGIAGRVVVHDPALLE
jgi:hypothetical protein